MPLPASLQNRIGRAFGEARPLLRGAQRPRGGGKLRGFAAHARKARERPGRALFSAVRLRRAIRLRSLGAQGVCQLRPLPATDPAIGQAMHVPLPDKLAAPSIPTCWEHPQPELCPQLVYPWGVTVTCGSWQGTPGGFSRGLAEVPLSALLPPTSWARKKSARPPGRVPAIYAAAGGSLKAPRRGAKKAPPGATRQIKETSQRLSSQMTSDSWRLGRSMRLRIASSGLRPS